MLSRDNNDGMKRKPKTQSKKLTDQLRGIITNCGQSRAEIARATGITEATLSYFMAGKRGISTAYLDVLGEHLGLELTKKRKR